MHPNEKMGPPYNLIKQKAPAPLDPRRMHNCYRPLAVNCWPQNNKMPGVAPVPPRIY
jgi:hypothetical protein